ncbi:MAG: hypothetical protein GF387_03275 [Candidatus Portnoybacteria bacterium]|nr:hypothetical protein [Candidatus Portnoybacteria bacterium]
MKKSIIITIVVVLLIIVAGAIYFLSPEGFIPKKGEKGGNAVAIVNGEEISQEEYNSAESQIAANQGIDLGSVDEETKQQIQNQAINNLVSQTLLSQAIENSDVAISEQEINNQIQIIKDRFDSEDAFNQALSAQGMTEEDLRSQIELSLSQQAYFDQELNLSSVEASEEEVASKYEEVAANQEVPPLEQVRDQVEQLIVQEKQQDLINDHVEELRAEADIQILI